MNKLIKIISIIFIFITIINFIPVNAEVIIPKYNYIINYYKDSIDEDNLIESIIGIGIYEQQININTHYKLPEGYSYIGEELILKINENDNKINVIYSKKNNLSYCVNYFYNGIISVNDTECFYNITYGEQITHFVDKPRDGYVFDSFSPITVLDIEENIMNVCYKRKDSVEKNFQPSNLNYRIIMNNFINRSLELLRTIIKSIY